MCFLPVFWANRSLYVIRKLWHWMSGYHACCCVWVLTWFLTFNTILPPFSFISAPRTCAIGMFRTNENYIGSFVI
uniref:Uncharacterized protein n=1 Tax=Arundo donax TaxID=35708 RepID=A0A0A9FR60_ARUDO